MSGKTKDTLEEFAGAAEQQWGEVTDSPRHQLRGAARRYSHRASHAAKDAADCLQQQVKENPTAGLAIAAGVGLLVGFLLGRR
ncbi:DUF883 family protein [Pantoea sp. A4]|uniref:DUF883 family protein n=1 Tax=Pantoea sp. A4 TaxID=1225184 RepID=UPI000376C845|nr:DUF883 family protein [Pantoea sp. A4]